MLSAPELRSEPRSARPRKRARPAGPRRVSGRDDNLLRWFRPRGRRRHLLSVDESGRTAGRVVRRETFWTDRRIESFVPQIVIVIVIESCNRLEGRWRASLGAPPRAVYRGVGHLQ